MKCCWIRILANFFENTVFYCYDSMHLYGLNLFLVDYKRKIIDFFSLLQSKNDYGILFGWGCFVCFLLKQTALSKAENSFREYGIGEKYLKGHLRVCCRYVTQTYSKNNFTNKGNKVLLLLQLMYYIFMVQKSNRCFSSIQGEYVNNHLNQALTSACALLGLFLIKLSACDIAVSTQFKCQEITGHFNSWVWVG